MYSLAAIDKVSICSFAASIACVFIVLCANVLQIYFSLEI